MKTLFPPPPQPPSDAGPSGSSAGFPEPRGLSDLHERIGGSPHPIEQSTLIEATIPTPGAFSLDDERVICRGCAHSWIFRTMFEAKNPHPDGRPWLKSEGYCAAIPGAVVSLQGRAVYECNRYTPREEVSGD